MAEQFGRIRSYRSKLKEWGATRSKRFEALMASTAQLAETTSVAEAAEEHVEVSRSTKRARHRSYEGVEDSRRDLCAHSRSRSRDRERRDSKETVTAADFPPVSEGDRISLSLQDLKQGSQVQELLQRESAMFFDGSDSLLHHAAQRGDYYALEYLVDFVLANGFGLDRWDAAGTTALQLAISANLEDSQDCIKLLLNAGASPHRLDREGNQPVHTAVRSASSASICKELLERGADANAMTFLSETPLSLALEQLRGLQDTSLKQELYVIVETLLNYGAIRSAKMCEHALFQDDYIVQWLFWNKSRGLGQRFTRSWLRHYFRTDWSPLCWFPLRNCPAHECDSFAAYIFAHTDSNLATTLIQTTDLEKHGTGLAYALVSPCRRRSSQDMSLSDLLRDLLARLSRHGIGLQMGTSLLHYILTRSPVDEKFGFFQTLLQQGTISPHDEKRTLLDLAREDLPLRLRLAELLLAPHAGMVSEAFYRDLISQCHDYVRLLRAEGAKKFTGLPPSFESTVLDTLDLPPTDCKPQVVQYVVHVLTRLLLDEVSLGDSLSLDERLCGALWLRQSYDLPEVPISSNTSLRIAFAFANSGPMYRRALRPDELEEEDLYRHEENFPKAPSRLRSRNVIENDQSEPNHASQSP